MKKALIAALFLAVSLPASALTGRIVGVTDGDTLTARCGPPGQYRQVKVRLTEIDAPERGQAFGQRSRQALAALCHGKEAEIEEQGKDRYGRILARVVCDGQDANAAMVRQGMAWVYDQYMTDKSLYPLQDEARAARRGLWADKSPAPPWEWRKAKRSRQRR